MTELWAGEFGRYQWKQYFFHIIPAFLGGMHMLSQVEVGATPNHRCSMVNDIIVEYRGSCHYVNPHNETLPCEKWDYDRTDYGSTIVTDWDLVCNRRWMGSVAQSCYMLGGLVAASILGQLSDRYGRRKVLVPTGVLQMIFAIGSAFIQNYYFYIVVRFLIAINVGGAYIAAFVLTLEMAPDRYRTYIGFTFQMMFAVGITFVAGWAYLIRDWSYLQLCFGLHSSVMLLNWWFVDESPRWLFSQRRYSEANAIICKMLIQNGKADMIPEQGFTVDQLRPALGNKLDLTETETAILEKEEEDQETISPHEHKYGIRDLFRTTRLRKRTINICLNCFAHSLVYYGLSLNTSALVGNPHLMLFISGFIEIPGYVLSAKVIDILGRRSVIGFCLFFGGLVCITTSYFPQTSYSWTTSTITVVMIGKFFISLSYPIIYNYIAELFPTVVRSSAVGIGSTFGSLSSFLTPLIFLLDSWDPKIPSVLFGVVSLVAGFFTMYLPETRGSPLMHTLNQGEEFGKGDTCFAGLCGSHQYGSD